VIVRSWDRDAAQQDEDSAMMQLPTRVRLVEVGPRDGLQNEPQSVPTAVKVALIDALSETGFPALEATSFVSSRWIPQLADAAEVMAQIRRRPGVRYPVLTPNLKGFEAALAAGADEVAVFVAATESFSQRNINCSVAESLARARPVFEAAAASGVRVRGYISMVLDCPYEGRVDPDRVVDLAATLYRLGAYEVSLGDTTGTGTPGRTRALFARVAGKVPIRALAGHFHDTYGQALANVYAVLQMGVATFDCSVAGLGGCPYAKGASGNVASEDLVYMLEGLGIETGVDLTRLRRAGALISGYLKRPPSSRVARALDAREPLAHAV
jgi:hydroxymethylglutaryl-CoA lyase